MQEEYAALGFLGFWILLELLDLRSEGRSIICRTAARFRTIGVRQLDPPVCLKV